MQTTSATGFGFASFDHVRLRVGSRISSATPRVSIDSGGLDRIVTRLKRARLHLGTLLDASLTPSGLSARSARVRSSAPLPIATNPSATTLTSTAEVNAVATSFSPFGPSFAGSSSSDPTVGGTYSGAQGDDTLTFEVAVGGVVGLGLLRIDVRDSGNDLVDTLDFTGVAAGTPVGLSNGLTLALSSGTLVTGDTFDVTVSATTGSAVDPDLPFNGARNQNPGFEPGASVTAGTFQVNGVTIGVLAGDTINAVLQKISESAAGVTGTFDTGSERVILTQKTTGSGSTIAAGSPARVTPLATAQQCRPPPIGRITTSSC